MSSVSWRRRVRVEWEDLAPLGGVDGWDMAGGASVGQAICGDGGWVVVVRRKDDKC